MKKLFILLFACLCSGSLLAQDSYEEGLFNHVGVGVRASTLGVGLEGTTTLSKNFKLRAGLNIAKYSHNYSFGMDDDNLRDAIGYDPDYDVKGKLDFVNGHLLVDIHPMRYGVFHFTAGFYIGNNKIKANGLLVNPETGQRAELRPEFIAAGYDWNDLILELDKYGVTIEEGGRIDAELKLGNVIKPYFGIGIGRSLPKSRIGFMFELGAMYQGNFEIRQNGKKVEKVEFINGDSFGSDLSDFTDYLKWWPMLNLQLTYRIF